MNKTLPRVNQLAFFSCKSQKSSLVTESGKGSGSSQNEREAWRTGTEKGERQAALRVQIGGTKMALKIPTLCVFVSVLWRNGIDRTYIYINNIYVRYIYIYIIYIVSSIFAISIFATDIYIA